MGLQKIVHPPGAVVTDTLPMTISGSKVDKPNAKKRVYNITQMMVVLTLIALVQTLNARNRTDCDSANRQTSHDHASHVKADALTALPTFSILEAAIIDSYGCSDASGSHPRERFSCALEVMELVEKDGGPVPITNHQFLYVGSIGAAYNVEAIANEGITHIVSATPSSQSILADMEYMQVNIHDTEALEDSIAPYLSSTADFIDSARQKGGKVLVHCWQGTSRSVSLIMAYLMKYDKMRALEALDLIRATRSEANPNVAYLSSMLEYEKQLGLDREGT